MSDGQNTPGVPPITKPPAGAPRPQTATPSASASPAAAAPSGVSRTTLIVIGIAVVLLSFVASFLGATLAGSNEADPVPAPIATVTETATPPSTEDYEAALEEILPAGAAVRAGAGVPEAGKGYEGEVYIDIATSDVYLFKDGAWVKVGNIRASAAENLTGETGAAGGTGATGETGASGAPGTPGTQLSLGLGAPQDKTCTTDGDIYIDTESVEFYECESGKWTLFGPTVSQLPAPTPTTDSEG